MSQEYRYKEGKLMAYACAFTFGFLAVVMLLSLIFGWYKQ